MKAFSAFLRAGALVETGNIDESIEQLQHEIAAFRALETGWGWPLYLSVLARAYTKRGEVDEGLVLLDQALADVDKKEIRELWAEVYRLKGELLLQQSQEHVAEAEACFRRAIEIAQKQSAKSWELRAAMSLARLWQGQGKVDDARTLLAPVYDWFTEGFDTTDLKDAKTLLHQLT